MKVDKYERSMVFQTVPGKTLLFVKWCLHVYGGH